MINMKREQRLIPARNLAVIVCSIFFIESTLMLMLHISDLPLFIELLLNVFFLVFLSFPFLFFFLYRPLIAQIYKSNRAREALTKSEERYKLAEKAGNIGSWDWNILTGDLYWSDTIEPMFGFSPGDFGRTYGAFLDSVHPTDRQYVIDSVKVAVEENKDYDIAHRVVWPDGAVRWVAETGTVFRDNNGKAVRMVGVVQDITERKKAEAERQSLEAKLLQSQKMETIGTLAGGIAHDFNNILSPIFLFAELARDNVPKGSEIHDSIAMIIKAAERGKDLVKRILLFSRKKELDRQILDLGEVVAEALKLVRSSMPSTITIKNVSFLKGEKIKADPIQIHQLVMNLCTNAFHALQQSGGTIDVSLSCVQICQGEQGLIHLKEGRYILLRVRDTGQGIDESIKLRIFDPFFTTKEAGKGTGLGLSVVRGIVMSHDGEITVESEMGKGTVFNVYFPQWIGDEEETGWDREEAEHRGEEQILFVDDEDAITYGAKNSLEQLGYMVTALNNPKEAETLFKNEPHRFDVLVTDYTMPNMTGLQLAAEVKKTRREMPVIVMSGYNDTISENNINKFNVDGFVTKPFSGRSLGTAIRASINSCKDKAAGSV